MLRALIKLPQWLLHGTEPPDGELFLANAASKFYWINRPCFKLEADMLWRIDPKSDRQQLLVPSELRQEILVLNHDIPMSGHQGEQRTIERVKAKYFWYRMSRT